jgi:molecular chaperone DnaK (HSP70)
MPYVIGIDVGTGFTAAATCRLGESGPSRPDVVQLGAHTVGMPSVVYVAPDGAFLVGEPAAQRGLVDASRTARDFVRRAGDDVPQLLAGRPITAEELTASLVIWVVQRIESEYGAPAEHVVLTHPAEWGPHRRRALHQALWRAGLGKVTLLPEPIAAGESHAVLEDVPDGGLLAVYTLGADSCSASVVLRTGSGAFELVAATEHAEHVGGVRFDDALLAHVRTELRGRWVPPDPADPRSRPNLARLRYECASAKERLSTATETAVPVPVPQGVAEVRVARTDFEELIRPELDGTVETLLHTLWLGSVQPERLAAVLLTGGSARIPLVTELVSTALPCQVSVEADPELTAARGAALAAHRLVTSGADRSRSPSVEETSVLVPTRGEGDPLTDEFAEPPPRPEVAVTPLELPERRGMRRFLPGFRANALSAVLIAMVLLGAALPLARRAPVPPGAAVASGSFGRAGPFTGREQSLIDRTGVDHHHEDGR